MVSTNSHLHDALSDDNSDLLVSLKEAREELHMLVQFVGMFPRSYLPDDPSDSTSSLIWNNDHNGLLSQPVNGVRLGLNFLSQELLIINNGSMTSLSTIGKTKNELKEELRDNLSAIGFDRNKFKSDLPYDLPEALVNVDRPFKKKDAVALKTLESLYAQTNIILHNIFKLKDEASEIRCWPHHFDIATLLTVMEHEDPEKAKSIGFGFSPGDGGYDEPYFYLTPWPYPDLNSLYQLDSPAIWNKEDWVGAVLKFNDIGTKDLKAIVTSFYKTGLEKLKPLL